jgi:hypothetical protein
LERGKEMFSFYRNGNHVVSLFYGESRARNPPGSERSACTKRIQLTEQGPY